MATGGECAMMSELEKARQFLGTRFFSQSFYDFEHKPKYLEDAVRTVTQLLNRSASHGESNSLLVIGPRGVGKSWVVEKALSSSVNEELFIKVYLNGLVHTDDYHALLDIAHQLDVHSQFEDEKLSSSAALNYMLDGLQSGDRRNKCVIFILDEFDLFTQHKNQTLLYNLLDICQSPVNPIALVGLSCRLDINQLLEKRVLSRFSHRVVHLFPHCQFEDFTRIFLSLLQLPPDNELCPGTPFCKKWNEHILDLSKNDSVLSILKTMHLNSPDCQSLKSVLSYAVSKIGSDSVNNLTVSLLLESYHFVVSGHQSRHSLLHDLSILELYLIVTCKNISSNDLYEFLNYEIIYEEYHKYASKYSHNELFLNKGIVFKALSRLVKLELLCPVSSASSNPEEYQHLQLMLSDDEITSAVDSYKECPTELKYFLTNQ
ncbi:PREDICTED: origin recognition complex subunit 4-like [Amphimedon queenslandica]|uniref:Origin recognition complex subunit 4 n=1 Tax=Amphimedon queenslandica TaxID=400682 RepID=A0A1X7UED5_AMPQE|nr:PREDICTED: origin recognition complex subunit 4-like [Amphimedon queenslandica]|eukprot:XP_019854656.1 PREDICTED: origin recognition complex subunit 4-like [Amphimedon queenslandica]